MFLNESTTPRRTVTPAGTATCAARYFADLIPAHAFVFRIPATDTRFTVYDPDPTRYAVGTDYTLTIGDLDQIGLCLDPDEVDQLRHCLSVVEHHFAEALAHARAGAARPAQDQPPAALDLIDVEPTPAGYAALADRFQTELTQVSGLRQRIDEQCRAHERDQT